MIGHALVLTAGLGTRLKPLTLVRAKPAVPVAGEPIARRIIRWLAAQQVTDLVLNLHHLPSTLTSRIGDGSDLGVRVRYSWEQPAVLGSAGGPRRALSIVGSDTFFLVNGDTLTDLALAPLAAAHEKSGALVTMALTPNREPHRYGGVKLTPDGVFSGFVGRGAGALGSHHFIGVQAARAEAFTGVEDGRAASVHDLYTSLSATRPGSIRGYLCDAAFWDIGTPADYWTTDAAFRNPTSPAASSILWDDVTIEDGAVVEDCIVTDGVVVPRGSTYRRSILSRTANGIAATPF